MDKGPWMAVIDHDGRAFAVDSSDFTHDVRLEVSGDFKDDAQRLEYCKWLARMLNRPSKINE